MAGLYFTGIFKCSPEYPDAPGRDRFIMSKGHGVPALYSILSRLGFFGREHLKSLRKIDSLLQGHPRYGATPGIDFSAGSLGQGLSVANGIALGYRRQGLQGRVYCLMGDGELQEGQIWEAALTTAQLGLHQVCAIIDNNHVQLDGSTASIKKMEPIADKWRSFGWHVIGAQGHDLDDVQRAYRAAMAEMRRPSVIIAETIKGKGVSFMENNCEWHSNAPTREELELALTEIREERSDPAAKMGVAVHHGLRLKERA
jgi:transketolase